MGGGAGARRVFTTEQGNNQRVIEIHFSIMNLRDAVGQVIQAVLFGTRNIVAIRFSCGIAQQRM